MTLEVRRATPDDLSGVLGVFLGCWRESYRGILPESAIDAMTDERAEALWRRVLADPVGEVLVAERDDDIVGVTRYATTAGEGAVHSLYVSPRAHGGGVGTALLSAATDALRVAGADAATLWVFAANTPSLGFYESRGWHADGATRTQPEFGEPEQRMRREWA
ncbi:GNAT family N-acetyltransferase [Microbacterium sp. EST19A]|uniref:GNAT family N-acetyltransferase n=1 Tax=Microbacterium sp. EST19A TaxID=2862681 RepID=UPI001CBB4881|nr:GNAT family N-acetyltransferase [Microbacterium sp. EST19A]